MTPSPNIEVTRLSTCSFDEVVGLWNEGFKGYPLDMTLSLNGYLARLIAEDLSMEHSLVALCDGKPAGFLLNGIRDCGAFRVAWNGGTGVKPEFRRLGVGEALVRASIDLYIEEKVDIATLEAIKENAAAIALYKKLSYEVVECLVLLQHEGSIDKRLSHGGKSYSARSASPHAVSNLNFYHNSGPWQVQWQSVASKKGDGLIIRDENGVEVCYALFKRSFEDQGDLSAITLFQCEIADKRSDAGEIVAFTLEQVYSPLDSICRRRTSNLSESNELVIKTLEGLGFARFVEQVHMIRMIAQPS
jgi:ribosomal protein S18 acetylase RimI-like enzyme